MTEVVTPGPGPTPGATHDISNTGDTGDNTGPATAGHCLPDEVPQQYKDQLNTFQKQIKILLQNHQVCILLKYMQMKVILCLWLCIADK